MPERTVVHYVVQIGVEDLKLTVRVPSLREEGMFSQQTRQILFRQQFLHKSKKENVLMW